MEAKKKIHSQTHNSHWKYPTIKFTKKKLKYQIKIKEIKNNFSLKDLNSKELPVYNVKYRQNLPFQKISNKSNKYIFRCFDIATSLSKDKKIVGFINCPISKETLFNTLISTL